MAPYNDLGFKLGKNEHCAFQYKGYDVSMTTIGFPEVCVFASRETLVALYTADSVQDAILWIESMAVEPGI